LHGRRRRRKKDILSFFPHLSYSKSESDFSDNINYTFLGTTKKTPQVIKKDSITRVYLNPKNNSIEITIDDLKENSEEITKIELTLKPKELNPETDEFSIIMIYRGKGRKVSAFGLTPKYLKDKHYSKPLTKIIKKIKRLVPYLKDIKERKEFLLEPEKIKIPKTEAKLYNKTIATPKLFGKMHKKEQE